MTETTTAATKAETTKHAAGSFDMPNYGIPKLEIPKVDLAKYGNAGGIARDG